MIRRLRETRGDFLMGAILRYAATLIYRSHTELFACRFRIESTCNENLSRPAVYARARTMAIGIVCGP